MKTYIITRVGVNHTSKTTPVKVEVMIKGRVTKLKPFLYYSRTCLDFGNGGSGAADLALTILVNWFGDQPTQAELIAGDFEAWKHHQRFRAWFIAPVQEQSFTITTDQIEKFMEEVDA